MTQDQSALQAAGQGADMPYTDTQNDIKLWEQRARPGLGGGGGVSQRPAEATRVYETTSTYDLLETVDNQVRLASLPHASSHTTPDTDLTITAETNSEVWRQFLTEHL